MNKIHHKTLEAQKRREALDNLEAIPSNEVAPSTVVEVPKSVLDSQNDLIAQQGAMLQNLASQLAEVKAKQEAPRIEVSKAKEYT